jgi:hypothetical protein
MHIEHFLKQWRVVEVPSHLWVQVFFHSLGPIPRAWYIHEETRRQMNCWQTLQEQFCKDFSFTSKYPELNIVLQRIREMIFTDICKKRSSPVVCDDHVHLLQSSLSLEIDKILYLVVKLRET